MTGVSCFPDSCPVRGGRPGGSRTGRSPAAVGVREVTGREPADQAAGNGSRGRAGGIRLFRCVPMFPVLSRCGQCRWLQSSLRVSPAVARVHGAVRVRTGGQAGSIKRAPASPDEGGGADTYALLGDMPAGHLDIGLAVPRGQPGPAAQLGGAAEPVHVADLGDDDRGQRRPVRQPRQAARSATPPPRSSGPAASADPARGRTPDPPASQPTPTTIRRSSRPGDKRRAPRTRPGLALGIRSASLWPAFHQPIKHLVQANGSGAELIVRGQPTFCQQPPEDCLQNSGGLHGSRRSGEGHWLWGTAGAN